METAMKYLFVPLHYAAWLMLLLSQVSCRGGESSNLSEKAAVSSLESVNSIGANANLALSELESLTAMRYFEYLDLKGYNASSVEDQLLSSGSPLGWKLSCEFTRHGTISSVWAWNMRIPVDALDSATIEEKAKIFLEDNRNLFGLNTTSDNSGLRLSRITDLGEGKHILRYTQIIHSLPAFGANLVLHLGNEGDIEWLSGYVIPEKLVINQSPLLSASDAAKIADGNPENAMLGWFEPEIYNITTVSDTAISLSWRISSSDSDRDYYSFVDAITGNIIYRQPLSKNDIHKEILFCSSCSPDQLPGNLQFDDYCHPDHPPEQPDCPEEWCQDDVCNSGLWEGNSEYGAYFITKVNDRYFLEVHDRDGWDNGQCGSPGHPCSDQYLHRTRISTDTAQGCGVWYDFDAPENRRAQISVSSGCTCENVITHEYTHAVVDSEQAVGYSQCNQSSIINEGIADSFGEFQEQHYQWNPISWIHGNGGCSSQQRNLKTPGAIQNQCNANGECGANASSYPNPDHYTQIRIPGCIQHWNSTFIGKSAYLLGRFVDEGTETHYGIDVTGVGADDASNVWYKAITESLTEPGTFAKFYNGIAYGCLQYYSGAAYTNCLASVQAIGLWSGDYTGDFNVNNGVSIVYLAPEWLTARRFLFHRAIDENDALKYSYRTCPIGGTCFWSWPATIAYTTHAPSAAAYESTNYVCYRNVSGTLSCGRLNYWGTFTAGPDPGGTIEGSPSLVYYYDGLFLAYRKSSGSIYWRHYSSGSGWSSETLTGGSTTFSPVLVSGNDDYFGTQNYLFLFYVRSSDNRLVYRRFNRIAQTWGNEELSGQSDEAPSIYGGGLTAEMYRGEVHIAYRGQEQMYSGRMYYINCLLPCDSRDDWSRNVPQEGNSSNYDLVLDGSGAWDGKLYLWYVPYRTTLINWRFKRSM